jgi:DNA-binding winged helix-turn-helix (wHTH) protein
LLYVFDDCTVDASRREVRRADKPIPVEPKVLDLVLYLLANRDRLVSKDELVSAVWNGRIVSDSAISACIHSARVALGDAGAGQRLIPGWAWVLISSNPSKQVFLAGFART